MLVWMKHVIKNFINLGGVLDSIFWLCYRNTQFFHWHNPSGCNMALGLTQPIIEMSTRSISWGV